MKIKKIDIPESTAIDASVLWGGINDNVLASKINELIDVVNKQQDIIRQIGEWGSSKGECLWCDTLTEFNPEKPQKETFVSIDEALKTGKNCESAKNTQKTISLLDIYNEMGEMYSALWNRIEDIRCELVHIQEDIEPIKTLSPCSSTPLSMTNDYTVVKYDELCRLRDAADELARLKGLKGFQN